MVSDDCSSSINADNVAKRGKGPMVDSVREQLSACLDGELPERELALLLKRLDQDSELRAAVGRYALISETLRSGKTTPASRDFAAGVMARIASDASASVAPRYRLSATALRRLRPAAGIAIAATVAALAIISVQRAGVLPSEVMVANEADPVDADSLASSTEATDRYVVPTMPSTSSAFVPAARLTNYVVAHSEYSSPLGRRSVLSGVLTEGEAELLNAADGEDAGSVPQDPAP
jgi:sigma-E factor negative regulatory protein RseA